MGAFQWGRRLVWILVKKTKGLVKITGRSLRDSKTNDARSEKYKSVFLFFYNRFDLPGVQFGS